MKPKKEEPWRLCQHEWGPTETFTEPDFGVAYASQRVCKKCRAREFNNWCTSRVGNDFQILPPEEPPPPA